MTVLKQKFVRFISTQTRLQWLYIFTVLGLLAGLFFSLPAWSGVRSYPLIPLFPLFSLPTLVQTILFLALTTTLLASLRYTTHRRYLTLFSLLSLVTLCILDITRFQPWVFHYTAILSVCLLSLYGKVSAEKTLDAARILIGGIYLWSGLQKLNFLFISETFPWFTQPLWEPAPAQLLPVFLSLGLLVPFLEVALALGLFFKRTRQFAIFGSLSMMLLVLMSLGPLGHNWNSAVWPWNVVLFLSVGILFWRTDFTFNRFFIRQKMNLLGLGVFFIFWLLPLGNVFGVVDHYLAWSLYSGRPPEATLIGEPMILEALSPAQTAGSLAFFHWSLEELNLVPYPEERVFLSIFQTVCKTYNNHPSLELQIKKSVSYTNTTKIFSFQRCADL